MKNHSKTSNKVSFIVGKSVRVIRKIQELSQNDLSKMTGIPQSTLSAVEHNQVKLDVEKTKVLARALKCHPAVLAFPAWSKRNSKTA